MGGDMEQHMLIVRSVEAWAAQADAALGAIEAANGGALPAKLADANAVDPKAFALLIEALVALAPATGREVDADLIRLAGLVPVDQVLP